MKPARTASQLLEQLDDELAWRLKELAAMRGALRSAQGVNQSALLRAAVPLLYAHWEGYVKAAATRYAAHLSVLGLTYGQVRPSFGGLKALSEVKRLHAITKRVFVASELLVSLHSMNSEKAHFALESYISNIGNMNYEMFEQIAKFLSIDCASYSTKKALIDESLLKQRNEIAHGDYLTVDYRSFESLLNEILMIMRQFKTDIQNAVVQKSYLSLAA